MLGGGAGLGSLRLSGESRKAVGYVIVGSHTGEWRKAVGYKGSNTGERRKAVGSIVVGSHTGELRKAGVCRQPYW